MYCTKCEMCIYYKLSRMFLQSSMPVPFLCVKDKIFLFTWLFTGRCTGTFLGIQDVVLRIGKGIGFYHVKTTLPKL